MGLLRIALALAVLLSHLPVATFHFIGGGLAVQAFFIVSGFYMALVLDGKYDNRGLFYSNRLLRLFPTYIAMMAIAAIVLFGFGITATFSRDGMIQAYQNPATAIFFIIENAILVGQDLLFWFTLDPAGNLHFEPSGALPNETTTLAWQPLLVPQAWSLSLELMFYALAPFLARLNWRWLAALAGASIALRLAGHWLPVDYGLWQGRFFPTALFLFLLGMLAHRLLPLAARLPKALGWIANAALLAAVVCLPMTQLDGEAQRWIIYAAIALAAPFIFNAFKNFTLDRWIGDLSYPMYLCHLVVVAIVLTWNPPQAAWITIGLAFALSIALYLLIDRPVDRWRQARAAKAAARTETPDAAPATA
ncbi:MAG: acyltransferase family protein [Hyphomonadaceae bacterium]